MASGDFESLLASLDGGDVSSLIALRVLLARADGDGVVGRDMLLAGVRDEYERWFAGPGATGGRALHAPFLPGESLHYLDEHVLPRLAAAGVFAPVWAETEPVPEGEIGSLPNAFRLAPPISAELGTDRDRVLTQIDERIAAIAGAAEQDPPAAAAVTVEEIAVSDAPAPDAPAAVPPPPARNGARLSARGLVKVYRKRRVVNEVDLQVSEGEIVGLLGPNGAGKTTTFYMMVGLIAPDRGTVHLGPENLTSVPMYKRARKGIGYLAQEPSIFRKLTVEENVLAILQMRKIPRCERRERLERLLDELGIKHLRNSKAYALSGGERRRLEITRALVGEPKFMLLDEPFAGVDPIAVHDIQQIVADLRRRGIGVLISDHNVEQTLDIVDRAYIMYDGRVRVSGTVSELVWNDEAAEIYLGPTLTARMRQRYSHPD